MVKTYEIEVDNKTYIVEKRELNSTDKIINYEFFLIDDDKDYKLQVSLESKLKNDFEEAYPNINLEQELENAIIQEIKLEIVHHNL